MILRVTHYAVDKSILHIEYVNFRLQSQMLEYMMRYIALAMTHNVERIDIPGDMGYVFRRNGELLELIVQ